MIAAIVPACGRSRRMGRPKLILPVRGRPLIARVIGSLTGGGIARVVVVAAPPGIDGATDLAEAASSAGAEVISPAEPTQDMRATVEFGVDHLARSGPPRAVVLVPADSVGLTAEIVRAVWEAAKLHPDRLVVPAFAGKRGHPLVLPWSVALAIGSLPDGLGVNALVSADAGRVLEVPCTDPGAIADLDTPEDYRRWTR